MLKNRVNKGDLQAVFFGKGEKKTIISKEGYFLRLL
jgi:hypothetical protein